MADSLDMALQLTSPSRGEVERSEGGSEEQSERWRRQRPAAPRPHGGRSLRSLTPSLPSPLKGEG